MRDGSVRPCNATVASARRTPLASRLPLFGGATPGWAVLTVDHQALRKHDKPAPDPVAEASRDLDARGFVRT